MTTPDVGFLLLAVVAAFFANELWRVLGAVLSARLDEDGAVFAWVRMVATALVAGLVAKLVLSPSGGFALAPLWLRLGSAAAGIAAYAVGRRSLALGVATAEVALILGMVALGA
ncbi:AzlD domain-containing protein [Hansschlegelia beijingensis]|uniref:AzlD domain-containing protein n=1 Tax=Hansschlegelia beijingensis TaxID=1133344 RepID=UPI00387F2787